MNFWLCISNIFPVVGYYPHVRYTHVTMFKLCDNNFRTVCKVYLSVMSWSTDAVNRAQLVLNLEHSFNIYSKKNSVQEMRIPIDFRRGNCKEQIKKLTVKNLI